MTEKSVPLSQLGGVNARQCAARTELFSITRMVALDFFNMKKQLVQCIG